MKKSRFYYSLLICLFTLAGTITPERIFAQNSESSTIQSADTTRLEDKKEEILESPSLWLSNTISSITAMRVPYTLQIDTTSILSQLKYINLAGKVIQNSLENDSELLRLRVLKDLRLNLNTHLDNLHEIHTKIISLNSYTSKNALIASKIQEEINYFNTHADSTLIRIYTPEIERISKFSNYINNLYTARLKRMVSIEDSINTVLVKLQKADRDFEQLIFKKEIALFSDKINPVWSSTPSDFQKSFSESLSETMHEIDNSISFFLQHSAVDLIFFRLFLLILCLTPIFFAKKFSHHVDQIMQENRFLFKYPILSSLILGIGIAPLLLTNAPFAYLDFLLMILILAASLIFIKENPALKRDTYLLIGIFYLLTLVNFLVYPTFIGRTIYVLSIGLLYPFINIYRIFLARHINDKYVMRVAFIVIGLLFFVSWVLIVLGYYRLGRNYMLASLNALFIALILYIIIFTLIDYLRFMTQSINSRLKAFKINKDLVEVQVKRLVIFLGILYFFDSFLKNLNLYDFVSTIFIEFINKQYLIGSSIFTIKSLLLFLLYFGASVFLANFIHNAVDTRDTAGLYKQRSSLGGVILLVRFGIICLGFVLGMMASGTPMDQFTIILGALSVGIGFGMQNIINNLVSGIIISIEKPFTIGDMIELGDKTGWVRTIGIRSSNIQTFDGSEVIVPNGDLVSTKVTNWTLSNQQRRYEIVVGVSYNSSPQEVHTILLDILKHHPEVLQNPEPFVTFSNMGDSALEFKLYYWIGDLMEGNRIKSEIHFLIFEKLRINKIEIPYPQVDVHLRAADAVKGD